MSIPRYSTHSTVDRPEGVATTKPSAVLQTRGKRKHAAPEVKWEVSIRSGLYAQLQDHCSFLKYSSSLGQEVDIVEGKDHIWTQRPPSVNIHLSRTCLLPFICWLSSEIRDMRTRKTFKAIWRCDAQTTWRVSPVGTSKELWMAPSNLGRPRDHKMENCSDLVKQRSDWSTFPTQAPGSIPGIGKVHLEGSQSGTILSQRY